MRTENSDVVDLYNIKDGDRDRDITRGACESSSIFETVSVEGNIVTLQEVPHHRVFGSYFFTRDLQYPAAMFAGDGENEFVFIPEGIKTSRKGTSFGQENTQTWWDWLAWHRGKK